MKTNYTYKLRYRAKLSRECCLRQNRSADDGPFPKARHRITRPKRTTSDRLGMVSLSRAPLGTGQTVREWLALQSFEAQQDYGVQILVAQIHDRLALILHPKNYDRWLGVDAIPGLHLICCIPTTQAR